MAKLVVVTKGLADLSHEVTGSWTTIGRAEGSAFQIIESSISGSHCEVQLRGQELAVRDLDSTNGTFVHGLKIIEAFVEPGQTLRVGDVDLLFEAKALPSGPEVPLIETMSLKGAGHGSASAVTPMPQSEPEPVKKYQVLLVDDSSEFLDVFGRMCSDLANQAWDIHFATSADRALVSLQQCPIHLAVLDIGMPLVDGLQLLGIIRRRYPEVKLAVMTGLATESNRTTGLAHGAELFIEKPGSAEETKVVFNMLNDLVSWAHREGFCGALRQVGLQEVIQMECTGRRSSILGVHNQRVNGQIYIEVGAIIHAVADDLVGDKALNRLLSLTGGEFQLKPFKSPPERTVHGCWEMLLMEAARNCDEGTADEPLKGSSPNATVAEETAVVETITDDDFVVVATYDGQWSPVAGMGK